MQLSFVFLTGIPESQGILRIFGYTVRGPTVCPGACGCPTSHQVQDIPHLSLKSESYCCLQTAVLISVNTGRVAISKLIICMGCAGQHSQVLMTSKGLEE